MEADQNHRLLDYTQDWWGLWVWWVTWWDLLWLSTSWGLFWVLLQPLQLQERNCIQSPKDIEFLRFVVSNTLDRLMVPVVSHQRQGRNLGDDEITQNKAEHKGTLFTWAISCIQGTHSELCWSDHTSCIRCSISFVRFGRPAWESENHGWMSQEAQNPQDQFIFLWI